MDFSKYLADGECPSYLSWPLSLMQDLGPGVGLAWLFRISFIFLSEFLSPSLMFVGIE